MAEHGRVDASNLHELREGMLLTLDNRARLYKLVQALTPRIWSALIVLDHTDTYETLAPTELFVVGAHVQDAEQFIGSILQRVEGLRKHLGGPR